MRELYDGSGVIVVVNILSLTVAASGWYYLFYSRAAHRLEKLENRRLNLARIRFRRAAGGLLSIMGLLIFTGSQHIADPEIHPRTYIAVWTGVMALLLAIVILAMIDLRLTLKIRNQHTRRQ